MLYGIITWIIISLIIIIVVHHLFAFFKNTLTVPKVKDLIHQPTESYKEIADTLSNVKLDNVKLDNVKLDNEVDPKEMKNELKNFFNELSQTKTSETLPFSSLESFANL
jgi:hypothetical protein